MTYPRYKLGELLKVSGGYAFKSSDFTDDGYPVIRISNIQNGHVSLDAIARIPESKLGKGERYPVSPGDILIAMSGATTGKIGVVPLDFEQPSYQNQRVGNFLVKGRMRLDKSYLRHFLDSEEFQRQIQNSMWGVAQPNISGKQLESFSIPLPPLVEQQRIAAILDKADALRAKRRAALTKLDTLLQSTFLDMFGDPVTNPKGWETLSFKKVVKNLDSKRIPVKQSDRAERQGPYPYYGASGVIDHVDDYIFDETTLLIAEDGMNLKFRTKPIAFIASGKYWVNNHAHVVSENGQVKLEYLRTLINLMDLSTYITGIDQMKLTRGNMDRIPIPTPPFVLQNKFVKITEKIHSQISKLKFGEENLDKLFSSLQQRAFKGEL